MRLRNAPLVHVLAQVVFEQVPSLAECIPRIQTSLRKVDLLRLVESITHQITVVEGGAPSVTAKRRWDFLDRDRRTGVSLSDSGLVLHTTDYQSVEPFFEVLIEGLTVLQREAGVMLVDRVGLRYIDLVHPDPDERFDQYVHPGVLGFPFDEIDLNATLKAMRTESVVSVADGTLVVRSTLLPPGQFVPADLITGPVVYPASMVTVRPSLALDFDHFLAETFDFESAAIIDRMGRLHAALRHAFDVVCKPYAFERWGPWE